MRIERFDIVIQESVCCFAFEGGNINHTLFSIVYTSHTPHSSAQTAPIALRTTCAATPLHFQKHTACIVVSGTSQNTQTHISVLCAHAH